MSITARTLTLITIYLMCGCEVLASRSEILCFGACRVTLSEARKTATGTLVEAMQNGKYQCPAPTNYTDVQ